jgi:hypothetical protein
MFVLDHLAAPRTSDDAGCGKTGRRVISFRRKPRPIRAFWYVSPQKLKALSADGGWLSRITSFKLGSPLLATEVGIASTPGDPRLDKTVTRLEKRLRKTESLVPVEAIPHRGPVNYFEYEGPTVRRVEGGTFYVAAVLDTIGVLLAGAAVNAIGATPEREGIEFGSESPVDAVKQLFELHGDQEAVRELRESEGKAPEDVSGEDRFDEADLRSFIDLIHMSFINHSGVDVASLPHTRGIALYAGAQETQRQGKGWLSEVASSNPPLARVTTVVVGSPVWVEQVTPTR